MYDVSNLKVVIADMDGTLVDDKKQISDHAIEVINRLMDHGIMFGLASGRNADDLALLSEKWGLHKPFDIVVGLNGSELHDGFTGKTELFHLLGRDSIKEIVEMMRPLDCNPYLIVDANHVMVGRIDEAVKRSQKRIERNLRVVEDDSEFWQVDAMKMMYRCDDSRIPEVKAWVKAHPSKAYNGFQTDHGNYEFADGRIDKAYPVRIFCERHYLDMSQIMYFGDMMNDAPLIKAAGCGVAMKNSTEDALEVCDAVTDKTNLEDGFADYLEKYVCKPLGI